MTVYITQEIRGRDLSDALEFGELEILIPAKEQVSLSSMPTVRRMERKLSKFTDEDIWCWRVTTSALVLLALSPP